MTQIADTDTLESEQDQETTPKPLTLDEARANRSKAVEVETEETPETEVEEIEEEEVETDSDVLSQEEEDVTESNEIDFEDLDEDTKDALAEKLEVRSRKAFAEQRVEIKDLKAQLEAKEAEVEEALKVAPVSDTPFANLRTADEVDEQVKMVSHNAEHWNDQLILNQETEYDEASGKDIRGVKDESGKFYPASQVLAFVKAERAKVDQLKARKKEIATQAELFSDLDSKVEVLKAELDLDDEASGKYDKMLSSPKFKLVQSLVPEYGAELVELLAYATAAKSTVKPKKVLLKRKAPKDKKTNAALPSNGRGKTASGRVQALDKIINGGGYTPQQKMNAMREKRSLNLNRK